MNKESVEKILLLLRITAVSLIGVYTTFSLLFLYHKLSFTTILISVLYINLFAFAFFWPYIKDLYNLVNYTKGLAEDNRTKPPSLNGVKVEPLSLAISNLNTSWLEKQYELQSQILENDILFNILPDMIIMLDSDSKIVKANDNAKSTLGEDIIDKNFKAVIDNQLVYDHIKWVMHDKKSKSIEVFLENLQKYFMFRIAKFPLTSPTVIAAIIVITDITKAKRTEGMFVDFVANASHEIRTPLSSIKGFVEILQTTAKDDPGSHERFLNIIALQAERLNLLIKELLSLSKLEFNGDVFHSTKVDIVEIINTAYNDTGHLMEEKNISFNFQFMDELPNLLGSHNELIQVFSNLFSNAIKYSYPNTEVLVTMSIDELNNKYEDFEPDDGKDYLKIQVIDQSEGIPAEHLSKLTERFYRVDSARTRSDKIGGTGLGLSIVKQIIIRHNGHLDIKSKINEGSIFSVILPLETE